MSTTNVLATSPQSSVTTTNITVLECDKSDEDGDKIFEDAIEKYFSKLADYKTVSNEPIDEERINRLVMKLSISTDAKTNYIDDDDEGKFTASEFSSFDKSLSGDNYISLSPNLHMTVDRYLKAYYSAPPIPVDPAAERTKKPGRPTKKPVIVIPPAPGILFAPRNEMNMMELDSRSIKEIKAGLTIAASFKCFDMCIDFRRHYVRFIIPVTNGNITMFIHLAASRLYSYYYKADFTIYVSIDDFKRTLTKCNTDSDRIYIDQTEALLGTTVTIGVRTDEYKITHIKPVNTSIIPGATFRPCQELDFTIYPIKISIDASKLKALVKSEPEKSQICYFSKEFDEPYVKMSICQDNNSSSIDEMLLYNEEKIIKITSNTVLRQVVAQIPLAALSKVVMHKPTDTITLYMPASNLQPFICEYKDPNFFMHIYILPGSM